LTTRVPLPASDATASDRPFRSSVLLFPMMFRAVVSGSTSFWASRSVPKATVVGPVYAFCGLASTRVPVPSLISPPRAADDGGVDQQVGRPAARPPR
jgi:hypothetical protein